MNTLNNIIVEKLDHFGRGIYKENYNIYFIDNALPGDVVDIEVYKDKKNIKECRVINYVKRTDNYRNSICKYSNICGGCNLIDLAYEKQLEFKKQKIQELVQKMLQEEVKINDIVYSNKEYNYRNKIVLHGENNKLGLYKNKSNDIVEINNCELVNKKINEIITKVNTYAKDNKIILNDLTIKCTTTDEILISIYGENINYDEFKDYFKEVKVIIINNQVVTKDKYIKEKLLDKEFYISNHSFFQVNSEVVKLLYSKIIEYAKEKRYKNALDLYCGTGTIGILISDYVDNVIGIEEIDDAINDAYKNKVLNSTNNIEFIHGKVENNLDNIKNIDFIVVDPPRAGLDVNARNNILKINPEEIIYVSCDPSTLMRDLKVLKKSYNIRELTPFDMFPNTYHVETVCVLERR